MKKVKKYISIMIIMLMIFENIETDGLLLKTTKIYGAETDKESVQEVDKDTSLETEEPQDIEVYNSDDEELVYGDYEYSIVDNSVTIDRYTGSDSVVVMPDNIDGYDVTGIAGSAFAGCTSIKDIKMPESITYIGMEFIKETQIETITIPQSVKNVEYYYHWGGIFTGAEKLKEVIFEDGIKNIPANVCRTGYNNQWSNYDINNIEKVYIPDSVETIEEYAFYECNKIGDVTLPKSLKAIEAYAFAECDDIYKVDFKYNPETEIKIGTGAFNSCNKLSNVNMTENIKSIGGYVFADCPQIKNITLPESVTYIGEHFIKGTGIEIITIPKGIENVGADYNTTCGPLTGAEKLKEVIFEDGIKKIPAYICKTIDSYGFNYGKINNIKSIHIPDSVEEIGESAFYGCNKIENITLPESLKEIGRYAFAECDNISKLEFKYNPETEIEIETGAFNSCDKLGDVKMTENIKSIGRYAFAGCPQIKNITLPESITYIGAYFISGTGIETITIPKGVENVGVETHGDYGKAYGPLTGAKELREVIFEDGMKKIPSYMCSTIYDYEWSKDTINNIKSIHIPDSVEEIGESAFYGCNKIENITLPKSMKEIGKYAFAECDSIFSIEFKNSVEEVKIGRRAFYSCDKLENVKLSININNIGEEAFLGDDSLTIYGYDGTYAQQYANENNIPFKLADDDDFDDNNYIYGNLTLIDPLNWQIGIDGVKYNLDSNYELTDEVKLWVQESDKRVVCSIKDGNVNGIYRLSDVTSIYIKLKADPSKLVYQNGKMNVSKFAVKADVQYLIDGKYNLPYSIRKQIYKDITNIELKTQSDGINFGKSGWGWFKDYKTSVSKDLDNSRINAGSSISFSEDIYINDDYKISASTGIFDINCAVTFSDGTKSENKVQVQVGNLDYRDKVVEDKKNNSVMGTNVSSAQKTLSSNANKAVTYDPMLDSYLTYEQQVHLKEVLYVWVSDIFAATNSSYCKNNNKIQDKIYKKLGIDKNSLTNIVNTNSTFKVELNTTVGKRTIEFDIKLSNYVLGQKVSYAGFGTMEFTMYKDRSKPELTGTGMVALTNMEGFVNQLTTIADNAIESAYMGIWGNDANAIANYLTSGTMLEVLKKNGVIKGTFSGNLYKLMKKPTTDYIEAQVHCPVDVYVYDSAGTLVGKIVNNEVDASFNELYMYTIGDSKYIQLTEDNYKLVLVGNDNGSMDYIVKEYDEDGNCKQTINYNNMDVVKGEKYSAAVPDALLLDASMYNLISYTGDYIEPTSVENSNDNIDDGNYEYVDKFNDLIIGTNLKTKLCQDINEYVIYGIKEETTVNDIKKMFPDTYIQIVSSNGELLQESEYVSTGCRINLIYDDNISDSVLIVIKGDVDGTGTIDVLDMETIQKSILGIGDSLSGVYKEAALLSGNSTDEVTVLDMEAIQKDILGIEKIN